MVASGDQFTRALRLYHKEFTEFPSRFGIVIVRFVIRERPQERGAGSANWWLLPARSGNARSRGEPRHWAEVGKTGQTSRVIQWGLDVEGRMQSHYREALARAAHLAQAADHDGALAAYGEAIALAPQRPDAYYEMGLLHHKLGRVAEAITCFERAAELAPEDATVWNNLGVLYWAVKRSTEAEESLKKAVRIDRSYQEAYSNLARMYMAQGNTVDAKEHLQRTLELAPSLARARSALRELLSHEIKSNGSLRIRIFAFSDTEPDDDRRLRWGDHWIKHGLQEAFEAMGHVVTDKDPDVFLHLFGVPINAVPRGTLNILWIHSHPDWVFPQMLQHYDEILCMSRRFIEKVRLLGYDARLLVGATSKRPVTSRHRYDLVFVGNAKANAGRKIVRDLGDLRRLPYDLRIWGEGWSDILPENLYGGLYYDNQSLAELYASSLISLNDHHEDMKANGFINPRIIDILASGGFCISDANAGIADVFGDVVPQYDSPEHLRELIDYYTSHPDERLKLMKKGRRIALSYTFERMAAEIVEAIALARRRP